MFLLYEYFFAEYFSGEHIWSSSQNFTFKMKIKKHHEDVKKLLRRIILWIEYYAMKTN